jgi:hypothetical protein
MHLPQFSRSILWKILLRREWVSILNWRLGFYYRARKQALKYRSVTDIVRLIRELVRRREEITGHSVRPKRNWVLLFVLSECIGVQPNCKAQGKLGNISEKQGKHQMFLNLVGNILLPGKQILFPQQCFHGWANIETFEETLRITNVSATMFPSLPWA